jgi:hypothetical protein
MLRTWLKLACGLAEIFVGCRRTVTCRRAGTGPLRIGEPRSSMRRRAHVRRERLCVVFVNRPPLTCRQPIGRGPRRRCRRRRSRGLLHLDQRRKAGYQSPALILPAVAMAHQAAVYLDCSRINSVTYDTQNPCQTLLLIQSSHFTSAEGFLNAEAQPLALLLASLPYDPDNQPRGFSTSIERPMQQDGLKPYGCGFDPQMWADAALADGRGATLTGCSASNCDTASSTRPNPRYPGEPASVVVRFKKHQCNDRRFRNAY